MKKFNFIALLGFVLVLSPQSWGQEHKAFFQKIAVEKTVKTPVLTQKAVKKYPFQKQRVLIKTSTFRFQPITNTAAPLFLKNLTQVVPDVSRFSRPKVIEEDNSAPFNRA